MLKKQYLKSKPICKVTFSLPVEAAKEAKEVKVLGDFNNWQWEQGALMKAGKKTYTATIELETGRKYQFRYLIDGKNWENDYAADQYVPSEFGGIENSVVAIDEAPAVAPKKATPAKKATTAKKAASTKKAVTKKATTTKKASTAKKAAPARKVASTKKAVTKKAAPAKKDDLKKIEGIGPKIATLLNEAGITTFAGLAKAKVAVLKGVLTNAGARYKMHDPTTWTEQAKFAAAGKWEALEKLQKELKGGKRK